MSKKKRYNFTLDEDLMMWFKMYCKENRLTASACLNNQIFKLYRDSGISKPTNVLSSKSD
jgi:hypothetical protein